ncbi:LacI family DNA-binding transcriptional regulator [Sphaerochaeta sp. PS]|uniref:LacI family DNA-binding transcriptional regulator n=1 Tax=Sphaerochaeta sp. PS TaxID=3076336 RepID=UPI0028A56429|nr:LacI family DNA-binding transcriptional regulator [Sphaerochaeta sp. PS]MDT4763319.1 LacI family DNA-binding transcriptional regulator [Sphaerochaeta sp. PS]
MTISEIAKLANVSIGTVDRVLHNRGRVAPETIVKVKKIVEDNGYQPNTFARNLKLSKTFEIGVLLPLLHSEYGYWNLIYEGVLKAAKELAPLSVTIRVEEFDRSNPISFLEKGELLMKGGSDAILMAPVIPDAARALLSKYLGLDYVFIDSPLPETHPVSSVVQDPFRGGFMAGRMMHLLSPHEGTYITVQTHTTAYNSLERARGFNSYFADKESYHMVELEMQMNNEGENFIERAYQHYTDIRGIFVVNDAVHRIANFVSLLGRKGQTILIGYDLIEQNRKAVLNGKVDCLLSQRPDFQGYTAVYQLYRKGMLNQVPETNICVPIDIVLPENLMDEKTFCGMGSSQAMGKRG